MTSNRGRHPAEAHWIFIFHLATTLAMTGIIWFIQIVHYPLLRLVGSSGFSAYETAHVHLALRTVVPLMVVELLTGVLLFWRRPSGLDLKALWVGLGLLGIIWVSSGLLQVPQHEVLSRGFNPAAYRMLVDSNWIRTVAWSARSLLVLRMSLKATP